MPLPPTVNRCWRTAWREGLAPLISEHALAALRLALEIDDARLLQGCIVQTMNDHVSGGCLIGLCGLTDHPDWSAGELEEYFRSLVLLAEERIGCGQMDWFLRWFDNIPRDVMRADLLPEVIREQARRGLLDEDEAPVVVLIAE